MRTTIRLDDQLLRDAKKLAAETGRTLTAVIEDALRAAMREARPDDAPMPFAIKALNLGPPCPGVDLNNSAALLDLMEQDDAAF